jgi:hypothetical protein
MIQYKLIKEYPGSQKLGSVISRNEGTNMFFYNNTQIYYPDAYPEFWEKLYEIDYEIINCYAEDLYFELKLPYYQAIEWNKFCKNKLKWGVLSVKRLSDGEVFTIGDEIYIYKNRNPFISKIEIMNNEIIIKVDSKFPFEIKLKNAIKKNSSSENES